MKKQRKRQYECNGADEKKLIALFFLTLAIPFLYVCFLSSRVPAIFQVPIILVLIFPPSYIITKLALRQAEANKRRQNRIEERGNFSIDEEITVGEDDVTFAKIDIADLPSMRKVANNPNDEIWAKLTAERTERMSKGYSEIFVAKKAGEIVGEITAHCANKNLAEEAAFGRRVYFEGFRVLPEYRRQHIGLRLMQFVINEFKNRGYYEFTIGVEADNKPALALYKKLGFNEIIAHGHGDEFDPCEYDLYIRRD